MSRQRECESEKWFRTLKIKFSFSSKNNEIDWKAERTTKLGEKVLCKQRRDALWRWLAWFVSALLINQLRYVYIRTHHICILPPTILMLLPFCMEIQINKYTMCDTYRRENSHAAAAATCKKGTCWIYYTISFVTAQCLKCRSQFLIRPFSLCCCYCYHHCCYS